jgi:GGDEF domain-containing protein
VRAVEVVERLRRELRPPYRVREHELRITTSVGILMTDPATPRVTPSDLLRDADQALRGQGGRQGPGPRVCVRRALAPIPLT